MTDEIKRRGRKKAVETNESTDELSVETTEDLARSPSSCTSCMGFNLLSSNINIVNQTKETLVNSVSTKKNKYLTLVDHNIFDDIGLPLNHFGLQILTNMKHLPTKKFYECIAKEGVGKSTLAFTLGGYGMLSSIPMLYIETEQKLMARNRIERCLSTNKELAKLMASNILIAEAFNLTQAWDVMRANIDALRRTNKNIIPKEVPIFVVLDTFSKLLSNEEAQGKLNYGDFTDKAKLKETGDATNFGHSKFAHTWCRELPLWLNNENCILLVNSHKNDKVDMSGFGSMFNSTRTDKTKLGGNAFNQNATVQLIINRKGFYKRGTEQVGETMTLTAAKNSYGPGNNDLDYNLITRHKSDTDVFQENILDFDTGLADYLISNKLLDLSVTRQRYSSKELNITNVTSDVFSQAFHEAKELVHFIGKKIGILGYN